jgi:hypothetical protein
LLCTVTVDSEPVPVIALLGTVTPCAWLTITEAEALIPGFTRESFWSRVSVAL